MEKVSNNIKFCTFVNILRTYSSKEVSISIKKINHHMQKKLGITLDRRTMYSYIKDMREMGLKVSPYDKEKEGYFLDDNFFEENELKLLMDSVKSSKFITKKKTEELLEKIRELNLIYRGRIIESNVFIDDTSKTANGEVYTNLNLINEAIKKDKKITFTYCYNNCNLKLNCNEENQNHNEDFTVNPICVVNNHENYYLLSMDEDHEKIISYRVDNMKSIKILAQRIKDEAIIRKYYQNLNDFDYMKEIL